MTYAAKSARRGRKPAVGGRYPQSHAPVSGTQPGGILNRTAAVKLLASWFGTGLILRRWRGSDAGSGTVGALLALGMALSLGAAWGWGAQAAAATVVTGASVWAGGAAASRAGEDDPAWVVIDEAAGAFIAVIGVGWAAALGGFIVFRVADATKRFPLVRMAERLPGGWGITADDVAAGLWGLAAAWLIHWLIG